MVHRTSGPPGNLAGPHALVNYELMRIARVFAWSTLPLTALLALYMIIEPKMGPRSIGEFIWHFIIETGFIFLLQATLFWCAWLPVMHWQRSRGIRSWPMHALGAYGGGMFLTSTLLALFSADDLVLWLAALAVVELPASIISAVAFSRGAGERPS